MEKRRTLWSKILEERRKNPYIGFFFPITKKHQQFMSSVSSTFRNRTSALVGFFSHSPPSTPLNFKKFNKGVLGVVKDESHDGEDGYQEKRRHVVTPVRSAREQIVDLVRQNLKKMPVVRYEKERRNRFGDFCVICMENFKENDKLRVLECQHTYHQKCIDTWLLRSSSLSCPLCKRDVLDVRACEGCSRRDCKSCGVGTWVYCKIGASLFSS